MSLASAEQLERAKSFVFQHGRLLERKLFECFFEDGGVATPYPDLPWWRPVFTLDGLILLKRYGLLQESGTQGL